MPSIQHKLNSWALYISFLILNEKTLSIFLKFMPILTENDEAQMNVCSLYHNTAGNKLMAYWKYVWIFSHKLQQLNYKAMEILEWVKKQTGKLADNVKDYKFYVKNQPNFIDSSTTLILTPYTNRDQIATVPCVYKWSRIKNGLLTQVPEFKGNSFICEPSDIGCIIQAEVTSTDGGHPGTAVLKFGPVKLDVLIKRQVEHSLTSGSLVMNVDLTQKDEVKQCQIKITEQIIKISHCNSNNQYSFDYTLGEPRIEASIKEPTKVHIFFNEKYESEVLRFTNSLFGFQDLTASTKQSNQKRLELKFGNRALKDNFLLIVKAFNTKKAMKTSAIVGKLQNVDLNSNQNFNYVLQIESLRADLIKLARLNDKFLSDKRTYYEEARKLEKQIEEIIVTYTKIAEGKCRNQSQLDQSVMELREKKDEVMQRKLHSLMRQNQTLKDRLEFVSEEMSHRHSQIGGDGLVKSNLISQTPLTSSRGGFIKKRTIPEVPVNAFDKILENLNQSEVKQPVDQQRSALAKQLNKSVAKIAQLQQQIKELKLNQSGLADKSSLSFEQNKRQNMSVMPLGQKDREEFCAQIDQIRKKDRFEDERYMNFPKINTSSLSIQQSRKHNMTVMELGQQERQKFCTQIDELRKKNFKLKEQNYKLKEEISIVSSRSEHFKVANQDNRSQKSNGRVVSQNQQIEEIAVDEKQLVKRLQQLKAENQRLKQQIQRLTIEKQIIEKEKAALEAKYKKRMGELTNQNSMYKRNQDALNRSQNLSMEMQAYNEQQTNMLKQQNELLSTENLKIMGMYKKAMEELKQVTKLKQQNLRLINELSELSAKHRNEGEGVKNQDN